jgi:hypothetical protein
MPIAATPKNVVGRLVRRQQGTASGAPTIARSAWTVTWSFSGRLFAIRPARAQLRSGKWCPDSPVWAGHGFHEGVGRASELIADLPQATAKVVLDDRILSASSARVSGRLGLRTIVAQCPGIPAPEITCELFLQLGDNQSS